MIIFLTVFIWIGILAFLFRGVVVKYQWNGILRWGDHMDGMNNILKKVRYGDTETLRHMLDNIILKYGVRINLADVAGFSRMENRLSDLFDHYCYHNNCFCNNMKKDKKTFPMCVKSKNRLCRIFRKGKEPFYGRCYMGLYEFYYPVRFQDQLISLICIGQFSGPKSESIALIQKKAERYELDYGACLRNYYHATKEIDFSVADLNQDVWMVCNYMTLLYRNRIMEGAVHSSLSKEVSSTADYYQDKYIVATAMKFINRNFSDRISLNRIAEQCHCNAAYLSHLFRKETGVSTTHYINRCRVERAKHLLDITDLTVTQISGEVGFGDSGYFSRTFKKIQGLSPTQYRRRKF